jgi:DNA-binding SARP family transcriptional activator
LLDLNTFGGLAVKDDGRVITAVMEHRKGLVLLAILAATGGMSRDGLMALLWPERDTAHARGALKQMLHTLRRLLGSSEAIAGVSELRLVPGYLDSDVSRFLSAVERGDPYRAVAEYRGPFLEGVHLKGSIAFELWLHRQQMQLLERYLEALESMARAADASGDGLEAVRRWRVLRDADPLNGRVRKGLMEAMARTGDRSGAIREARLHQEVLAEELGVGPDPEVLALRDRLTCP